MTTPPARPPIHGVPALDMPEDLRAVYANLVRIAHSPSEMVLDFAHLLPGVTPAQVCARVIMSPLAVKLLHRALAENLSRYEATFGEIKLPGEASLADYLFRPPQQPGTPPATPIERSPQRMRRYVQVGRNR